MKKQKEKVHNKRAIVAISVVGILALVGITFAFGQDLAIFGNIFRLGGLGGEETFVEHFESPESWGCRERTPKTVTYTNNTGGPRVIRVKIDEYWKEAGSTSTTHDTELPLDQNGRHTTYIEFKNENDWVPYGDYYYYNKVVADGETTSEFMDSVYYNCDFDEIEDYQCTGDDSTGQKTCTSEENDYAGAKYHLLLTFTSVDADNHGWPYDPTDTHNNLYRTIVAQANDPATTIDYYYKATNTGNPSTSNGNGVNKFTENGRDIYVFRGQVNNNNVIWANYCWRMVRTTATGGVKMIYNGEPIEVDTGDGVVKQCGYYNNYSSTVPYISYNGNTGIAFNNLNPAMPGSMGYMYGDNANNGVINPSISDYYNKEYILSNKVTFDGNMYTLDTREGYYMKGTWYNIYSNSNNARFHYFCMTGDSICAPNNLMYSLYNNYSSAYTFNIGTTGSLAGFKQRTFQNNYDSNAKKAVETWFESNNLDGHVADTRNYEDDLEDAVYCSDRSFYYYGDNYNASSFMGEDIKSYNTYFYSHAWVRNTKAYSSVISSVTPTLSCSKEDSFTKDNDMIGNGKLAHKIALLSADEMVLAGANYGNGSDSEQYLYGNGAPYWSMTPGQFSGGSSSYSYVITHSLSTYNMSSTIYVRPVVSLKAGIEYASGDGSYATPYVIE